MKKLLSILLVLCMLFAMFIFPASAEGETGYYLHIGDSVKFYAGEAGTKIKFPMPLTNDENKHFVGWCNDEACTDVVKGDPKISSGEPEHYYAWLKDYTTYFREEFNNVVMDDTVLQYAHFKGSSTTYHGYVMPLYGKSGVSQGESSFVNKFTGWAPYYLFLKDSDGAYVSAAPDTTYHMAIKYRVPAYSSGNMKLHPVYGLHARFAGMANNNNMELHSKSGSVLSEIKSTVSDWVTKEVDFTTGSVAANGVDTYIPNIGFRLYTNGTLTFEIDYVEIERYKNVNFKFMFATDKTQELLKGDTIEYPALENGNLWSLSREEYIPVPETMGLEDVTVYEYSENTDIKVHVINFIENDGTESKLQFIEGKSITYPALTPAQYNKADVCWSLSKDSYVAPPKVMGTEDITVYEYVNSTLSFENYNHSYSGSITNNWLDNAMISDEMAYSGNYSMRYRNYNLKAVASKPSDWESNYTNYYRYDEEADKFVKVADATAPAFVSGEFYGYREGFQMNQGTFFTPIYLGTTADGPYTYDYKLSVKYYVPEGNGTAVKVTAYHINTDSIFFAGTKAVSETYTIPATASGGWKTLNMDISANNHIVDADGAYKYGGQAIVLKVNTVSETGVNDATTTVYFDDIICQNMGKSGVTFVDGKFETTVFGERGAVIEYPALSGNAKWSLSKDEYIPVPETFDGRITVYVYGEGAFLYGDCDGDGEITSGDLAALKLHLAGIGDVKAGADCDGNGSVDTSDLASLKLCLAGVLELGGQGGEEKPEQTETVITNMGIPTDYLPSLKARPIWDLKIWDGKMYIGNGDYNASTGPLPIMAYNFETGEWENTGEAFEEEISRYLVINGELVTPGIDPRDYHNKGNYYVLRNGAWVKVRQIPSASHTYDMIAFDGKLFAGSGTSTDYPTSPISASSDNGASFQLVALYKNGAEINYKETFSYMRCHELFTIKDDLFALVFSYTSSSRTPEIFKYNKSKGCFEYYKYSPEYTLIETDRVTSMYINSKGEFGDYFFYTTDYMYSGTDIDSLYKVELPDGEYVSKFITKEDKMYILAYTITEVNGVKKYITRVYETPDGRNNFKKLFEFENELAPVSFEKNGNDFYVGLGLHGVKHELNGTLLKVTI